MKGPGIFSMLQIAAGLSMAGPMFVVGFEFVRTDRVIPGIGFFLLGAIALYFPTYLVKRIGGPRNWLRWLASSVWSAVKPGSSTEQGSANGDDSWRQSSESTAAETQQQRGSATESTENGRESASESKSKRSSRLERFRRR
ncbi:uncharacterized protein Nmag_1572 [Natrialba magadii ATCC 43099]|uniref:Uncharacterized protein n=1 Tax=Natrialba magadii (strain ATCC 43099 / DSM 3394 / CCM 3739 / CIP 104546 / IAM 13178 / JCM 8861 / NBRC 102185 / NCIMB 2190 / MS3) TaxID=547559 RepID=D3SU90_NATMM|nr:hypothetical protein [Natrialba magadii]ADD05148.1 uncharacterized protein Nmag_1572 [Natrialba magadii ATCC 43099]ELY23186.1 hypothetical protein C500_20391 [Natrialba magadii ATCC 43099]